MSKLEQAYEEALSRHDGTNFEALSERDRILVTIWGLEAEVNNGGFHQYSFNSAGDQAYYAGTALRAIGAITMAEIAVRAASVFGSSGVPRDWQQRRAAVSRLSKKNEKLLDELDSAFFEYPDDINSLLEAHIATLDGD